MDYLEQVKGWKKRRLRIVKLKKQGKTFAEIAAKLEITRQRVQQLYDAEVKNGG